MPLSSTGARFALTGTCLPAHFDKLLRLLYAYASSGVRSAPDEPQEGLAITELGAARLHSIVASRVRVAAFRSVLPDSTKPADRLNCREVSIADVGGRCAVALAEWLEDRAGHRVESKSSRPDVWEKLIAGGMVANAAPAMQVPTFAEIRGALNGAGGATDAAVHQDTDRLEVVSSELTYYRSLAHELNEALRRSQARISSLQPSSPSSPGAAPETPPDPDPLPSLADLASWSLQFEDRLLILPRALAAARKSDFIDVSIVETALRLLAGPYREMRHGRLSKDTWDAALANAHLKLTASAGDATYGQHKELYVVRWHGKPQLLEWHLGRGSSHDPLRTLRVYFFYDEELQIPVIGHLPTHLRNTKS